MAAGILTLVGFQFALLTLVSQIVFHLGLLHKIVLCQNLGLQCCVSCITEKLLTAVTDEDMSKSKNFCSQVYFSINQQAINICISFF